MLRCEEQLLKTENSSVPGKPIMHNIFRASDFRALPPIDAQRIHPIFPPQLTPFTVIYTYTAGHFSGGRLLSLEPGRRQTWRMMLCSKQLYLSENV